MPLLGSVARRALSRHISPRIVPTVSGPVDLSFSKVVPESGNDKGNPLVIMHGLFGSKRNWASLTKAFARTLDRPVYTLDLRNHGESPHALPMNYSAMAHDVLHFFDKYDLSDVALLGHSMGGKVAMAVALTSPSSISHLIVTDIAPSKGKISKKFEQYVEVMQKIEGMKLKTRKEAADVVSQIEKDPSIAAFLLTNLIVPPKSSPNYVHFRVPLNVIASNIPNIGDFPYKSWNSKFEGKTLFIKGERSNYINRYNIPFAKDLFPNMVLETLDAGHWVHAEKPIEFMNLVTKFIA